jgi:hypothetical protein
MYFAWKGGEPYYKIALQDSLIYAPKFLPVWSEVSNRKSKKKFSTGGFKC